MTSIGGLIPTFAADLLDLETGQLVVEPVTNSPVIVQIFETEFGRSDLSFQTDGINLSLRLGDTDDALESEVFGSTLPGGSTGRIFVPRFQLPPFGGNPDPDDPNPDDPNPDDPNPDDPNPDDPNPDDPNPDDPNPDDPNPDDPDSTPNQPPVANNDQFVSNQAESTFFNVLENDVDPDGDVLTIGTFSETQNGTLTFAGAGIFTYEPNPDFFGQDGFSYTVTDGTATDLAEVTIILNPVERPETIEGIGKGTTNDDTIVGSSGEDVIDGLEGNDSIFGLAGNDRIQGNEGNDTLFGNTENDTLEGGTGNDQIYGGKQADVLQGDEADDLLFGNLGADTLLGGVGQDSMYGGQANDSLRGGQGNDLVLGDKDNDFVWGDAGNDSVYGGSGEDLIFGNDGADSLLGDTGNDTIFGGTGSDTALGGDDNDQISGEVGPDFLFGGIGADTLTGGTGSDTFGISPGTGGASIEEANLINDFQPGEDRIGLAGGLSFNQLSISQSSENAGDTIIRQGSDGEFLAVLVGVSSGSLSESDFLSVSIDDIPSVPATPPTPVDPTPVDPTPVDPTPVDPTPVDPTPVDPTPVDPTPVDPTPVDPTPVDPTPVDPTPVDPTPVDPTPPANQPPVAQDDLIKRNLDGPVTFNVLDNDQDPEGDIIQISSFSSTTNGELIPGGGGEFTYVPNPDFEGTESFTYVIVDTANNSAQATVTIAVNQPPQLATNQLLVVNLDSPQAETISRDTLLAVDADDPPSNIRYIVTQETQRGDLILLGTSNQLLRTGDSFTQANIDNGSLQFDARGPAGEDGFLFAVTDGVGTLPQTSFNITLVERSLTTTPGKATVGGDIGEQIVGTDTDDTLIGGGGRDVLIGKAGQDLLDGSSGNDVIQGGGDNDTLIGQQGNDSLVAGSGNDSIDGGSGLNTLLGDDGNDTITGGDEGNFVSGGNNNDSLVTGLGSDTQLGGSGNDTLISNEGDDELFGEAGEDILLGGAGRDLLQGGEDNDTLQGQNNNDTIFGGEGSDSVLGEQGDDTILGGSGNDTVDGGIGDDSVFGQAGNDSIIGEAGQDSVFAGEGNDNVFGNDGNDLLFGESGNDTVFGGVGNDTLEGGAGGDRLTGNVGNDIFQYRNPGEGIDVITDFDELGNEDQFLIVSGENNFSGLVPNVGSNASPLQQVTVTNVGSDGDDISGRQLIIFGDVFDNAQAVNAALKNQNGSGNSSALIVFRSLERSGSYVLGFDPDLSDDSLPAFELGILSSIDPSFDVITDLITPSDFIII